MYGNPIDRTFIMESVSDVKAVIRNFNDCPITKRHILASNIKKAFNEFSMKQPVIVEENNMILNYLKSEYVICEDVFGIGNKIKKAVDKSLDKKAFKETMKNTLIINKSEINKIDSEIKKDIKLLTSSFKNIIPSSGYKVDKFDVHHGTSSKNGYEFHYYNKTLMTLNDKKYNLQNEFVKSLKQLGFKKEPDPDCKWSFYKEKNGIHYITVFLSKSSLEINLEAKFAVKNEDDKLEETYKLSEIEVDELKYKTYENINDVLSKLEPITESDLSYEQVVNSSSFPDTELTKKIKKLCVRNEREEIITNLSDIDIFKIKAKLLKTSPGSVKIVNDNNTTFAVIENQTFTVGKINDKEYVLINEDMKYKKLYIDEITNIKSIEKLKKNMG